METIDITLKLIDALAWPCVIVYWLYCYYKKEEREAKEMEEWKKKKMEEG